MVASQLRGAAPELTRRIDDLVAQWTRKLSTRLSSEAPPKFRPKQVNDPIWGTIELLPWEVALLDTPLLQRMRGVRQLGLAQLVFPGACHDRLEHILGVIGATDVTLRALDRQLERWNRDNQSNPLPRIADEDVHALRLAALFHDLGHGPFSHALEPVLERASALRPQRDDEDEGWRGELGHLGKVLQSIYSYNSAPPVSELIAVMIVISAPMTAILENRRFPWKGEGAIADLQDRLVAAITGAVEGPGADHLSQVISGQIDADKLDYLQRDAHHAGLEIGFDISRLTSRIEVLQVREDNVNAQVGELRERVAKVKGEGRNLLQIGIAASGFGSFEQMLIGRTFLYDRLYHHHKVRAAEAMAQRLILIAERDRPNRFEFEDLFINLGDEAFLRLFAGDLSHARLGELPPSAARLAEGILERELLHRAYALRGRFIAVAPGIEQAKADQRRRTLWGRVVSDLSTLRSRYDLGLEIHGVAVRAAAAVVAHCEGSAAVQEMRRQLETTGPDHVIVDLPSLKADAIRILARYPNGALRIPEFSFNPYKWSNAYELQKRTAYVFCPRDVVPMVALASKIVFFGRYGIVMGEEADGFIKAGQDVPAGWLDALVTEGVIDDAARRFLVQHRRSLVAVEAADLRVPTDWLRVDEDLAVRLAKNLNDQLSGGVAAEQLEALGGVLEGLWRFVNHWHASGKSTRPLANEAALQREVRAALEMAGLRVSEGARTGGGELDLLVSDAVLIENKFEGLTTTPDDAKPAAGMQGRRYAIALDVQLVVVIIAYRPPPGGYRDKTDSVTVREIAGSDGRRSELRIALPYDAVIPSREKA